jgi:uncharacterized membrane protein
VSLFFSQPIAIQIHIVSVVIAVVLAALQLALPKGGNRHRCNGYVWAASMYGAAISSFWISKNPMFGPFGPIHILSVITLIGVPSAIWAAHRKNIRAHQLAIFQLVGFALIGAGAFAILEPGRLMNTLIFGAMP